MFTFWNSELKIASDILLEMTVSSTFSFLQS